MQRMPSESISDILNPNKSFILIEDIMPKTTVPTNQQKLQKTPFKHLLWNRKIRQHFSGVNAITLSAAILSSPFSIGATVDISQSTTFNQMELPDNLLPPELQPAKKWQAFKKLWQKLNTVATTHSGISPPDGQQLILTDNTPVKDQWPTLAKYKKRVFYQALSQKQAKDFQTEINQIFGEKRSLTSTAALLKRLAELRIQEMSLQQRFNNDFHISYSVMCRAMPPACITSTPSNISSTQYLVNAIDRLELRTRALKKLQQKKTVSNAVFAQALAAIQANAKLALYLDALSPPQPSGFSQFIRPPKTYITLKKQDFYDASSVSPPEAMNMQDIQIWENAIRAAQIRTQNASQEELTAHQSPQNVQHLLNSLSAMRQMLDQLDPLLAALEQ